MNINIRAINPRKRSDSLQMQWLDNEDSILYQTERSINFAHDSSQKSLTLQQ